MSAADVRNSAVRRYPVSKGTTFAAGNPPDRNRNNQVPNMAKPIKMEKIAAAFFISASDF
jgi:hypothetical protein